jgi:hypothetical protein
LRGLSGSFRVQRVPQLARGGRWRASIVASVGTVKAGTYRVFACADRGHAVREVDEANNCAVAARVVRIGAVADEAAPVFAGLLTATTCIPGPVGPTRARPYRLTWRPAQDDSTPSAQVVYDVFQATAAGAEDFSAPTYTTSAGETSFTTPALSGGGAYYFVVRARDGAGNSDANRVERVGVNVCL